MVDKLLEAWGFPQLIQPFQDHDIDEEALLQIVDYKILDSLIPKIGAKIKFMNKLRNFQTIMKCEVVFVPDGNNVPDDALEEQAQSTSSTDDDSEIVQGEIKEAFKKATKRQLAFCGEQELKRACREVYNLDITEFLQQSILGKHILNSYQIDKRLNKKSRNQLVSLLLTGLLSQDRATLIPVDFHILSDKICEIFPNESKETYYIPRVPGNKKIKPVNAKGKLIDKYRNLRRLYNLYINHADPSDAGDDELQTDAINGDLQNTKLWLKTFQEPWDMVLEKWKETFALRKNDKSSTIEEFILEWPILSHREAYTLIDSDFNELYPNSLRNEYSKWERFFENLKNISKVDAVTEEFLSPLQTDINEDCLTAIQIAALPMLFPPTGRIRCQKVHWKPSIIECQESLINLVPNCGNINECIAKRRNKLLEFQQRVQPYIIVVGSSFTSITDFYLVIDSNIYRMYSVIQALDFTFKAFHALNAKYPRESEHIWSVIERVVYKIESSEIRIPGVLTVLKDLERNV